MTQMMSRPWPEIRRVYADAPSFAWTNGMIALVDRLAESSLHAWTSMFDLCLTQVPTTYPYDGPMVKVSPVPDTDLLELRWPGGQTHAVAAAESVLAFEQMSKDYSWHWSPRGGA
jgi:hypothetical protein